jgi:hypothetical protein
MYPLRRQDERILDPKYSGVVVTCDVDKTYLDTDFKSMSGLLTIPLEWAEDKKTVVGMAPVLRALRFGPGDANAQVPFYFLTAGPPFLVRELKRKMLLDRVQADGITSKDWVAILIKRRRPAWIKRQVAYKLCALFHQRAALPKSAKEILIGDDMEADAFIYSLYARIISGDIAVDDLDVILEKNGCDNEERNEVRKASSTLSYRTDAVLRIYIYLAAGSDPSVFDQYGKKLIPCQSPFQQAVHLVQEGLVRPETAAESAEDLILRKAADPQTLAAQLDEGISRLIYNPKTLSTLRAQLVKERLLAK